LGTPGGQERGLEGIDFLLYVAYRIILRVKDPVWLLLSVYMSRRIQQQLELGDSIELLDMEELNAITQFKLQKAF
jgi:hypothetical protein